jgi:hypothetical protein
MRECFKRVSVFFVALTIVTMFSFPVAAFAETPEQGTGSALTGKCGGSATYEVDRSAGTLTIGGSGAVSDYAVADQPWKAYKNDITKVIIENGITAIGKDAFSNLSGLRIAVIPASVTTAGKRAFAGCRMMTAVMKRETVPAGFDQSWIDQGVRCLRGYSAGSDKDYDYALKDGSDEAVILKYNGKSDQIKMESVAGSRITGIAAYAFYDADVFSLQLPDTISFIDRHAFDSSSTARKSVDYVNLPKSLGSLGVSAFSGFGNTIFFVENKDLNVSSAVTADDENIQKGFVGGENETFIYGRSVGGDGVRLLKCRESLSGAVTLPDQIDGVDVTGIGNRLFEGADGISTVSMPAKIKSIGAHAFDSCSSLTAVSFGSGASTLKNICDSAFDLCEKLRSFSMPSTVEHIGDRSFANCEELQVDLPAALTYIGANAFSDCSKFDGDIPSGVTHIGAGAFFRSGLTAAKVPSGVTSLEASVFANCAALKSVILTDNISSIGAGAFSGCSALTAVDLPDKLTSIEADTFNGCSSLKEITIPAKVESLGNEGFAGCSSLTAITIPDTVKKLGTGVFRNCRALASVTLPEDLDAINDELFAGCALEAFDLSGIKTVGAMAFAGCPLKDISNASDLESIGSRALEDCCSLTDITLPQSLKTLDLSAVNGCSGLKYLSIPENTKVSAGNYVQGSTVMFFGATSIPDTVKKTLDQYDQQYLLGYVPHMNHDYLYGTDSQGEVVIARYIGTETTVSVPAVIDNGRVKGILCRAFEKNSTLTTVSLPATIKNIANRTFADDTALTTVNFPAATDSIGKSAFENCTALQSITLPAQLKTLGDSAFEGCSKLNKVELDKGLTSIGSRCFCDCGLSEITIPSGVTTVGSYAFGGNGKMIISLMQDSVPSGFAATWNGGGIYLLNKEAHKTAAGIYYYINDSSEAVIFKYTGNDSELTIPDTIDGHKVTEIEKGVFSGCTSLTVVSIGKNVKTIGDSAFSGCTSLKSVTLPEGLEKIPYEAFSDCSKLESVTMPATLKTIEGYAFNNCGRLSAITLPTKLISLGKGAFYGCKALKQLVIPASVKTIGSGAFKECTALSSVELPAGLTAVSDEMFASCSQLQAIALPESVTMIGSKAFSASGIESFSVGIKVTSIGSGAFAGCSGLKSFTVPATVKQLGSEAFSGCKNLLTVKIKTSLTSLGDGMFSNCTSLSSVELPGSIRTLGSQSFYHCPALTKMELPAETEKIGASCFEGCSSLAEVGFGNKVSLIDSSAFAGCTALKTVQLPDSLKTLGFYGFANCTSLATAELPDGLAEIGISAFKGCTGLKTVNCPAQLTSIGSSAFEGCTALEDFVIGNKVSIIGSSAFQGTGLRTLNIPAAVSEIGYKAFYDCRQLTEVRVYSDNCNWSAGNLKLCPALKHIYGHYKTSTYYDFRTDPRLKMVINDEDMKITLTRNKFEYSGKDVEPAVRIKGLKSGTDYKVSYMNNDRPGVGSAVIRGKGTYYGTVTKKFIIIPQRASIRKISTSHKRSAKITWKRDARATGYQISVSRGKYSTSVVATINRNKTVTYTKTRLKKGNTYYVKVRAFVKKGNVRHFGDWSAVKKCRIR